MTAFLVGSDRFGNVFAISDTLVTSKAIKGSTNSSIKDLPGSIDASFCTESVKLLQVSENLIVTYSGNMDSIRTFVDNVVDEIANLRKASARRARGAVARAYQRVRDPDLSVAGIYCDNKCSRFFGYGGITRVLNSDGEVSMIFGGSGGRNLFEHYAHNLRQLDLSERVNHLAVQKALTTVELKSDYFNSVKSGGTFLSARCSRGNVEIVSNYISLHVDYTKERSSISPKVLLLRYAKEMYFVMNINTPRWIFQHEDRKWYRSISYHLRCHVTFLTPPGRYFSDEEVNDLVIDELLKFEFSDIFCEVVGWDREKNHPIGLGFSLEEKTQLIHNSSKEIQLTLSPALIQEIEKRVDVFLQC